MKNLHSEGDIPNLRYANEGKDKVHPKQGDKNRQEVTTLDSKGKNVEEDDDDLGLSLPVAKTFDEFEERLEQLQKLYFKEARRFQRQLKLSQIREEVHHSTQSAFTPVRLQDECYPRILFWPR